jgi:hypothetical protein
LIPVVFVRLTVAPLATVTTATSDLPRVPAVSLAKSTTTRVPSLVEAQAVGLTTVRR